MILLNGVEIKFNKFPNAETLVPKFDGGVLAAIDFKYEDDGDLIKLMFVKKHLAERNQNAVLRIYYMPYSRMDRSEDDSVFTLKHIADFINSLNFLCVTIVEPHSDVTTALINKSRAIYPTSTLLYEVEEMVEFDRAKDFLFFPDAGAQKRYSKLFGYNQLVGHKNRDFATGAIRGLDVVGEIPYTPVREKRPKVIIVDDLSSYGTTFIKSAERLRVLGIDEVYLLVAHAENSIFHPHPSSGVILLDSNIDKVFTTDSLLTEHKDNWHTAKFKDKLHVFNIKDYLI